MRPGRPIAIASLLLCCAASCRKDEPKGSAVEPAAPSETVPAATGGTRATVPTHEYMQEHFDRIVGIRDGLIAGNLEAAKANALWLVEHETDPAVSSWSEYVVDVRQQAAQVVSASDFEPAAAAAAELAKTCGRCHVAHGVSPALGTPEQPVAASGQVPHMRRHQWAADRMWEGLIGPSETRWQAGVEVLAEAPLTSDEIFTNQSAAPWITELAAQVHELGKQARGAPATAWDTRSAVYGRFLSTCARCHEAIPSPPSTP